VLGSSFYYIQHFYEVSSKELDRLNQRIRIYSDVAHVMFLLGAIVALIVIFRENDRGAYRVSQVYKSIFNELLSESRRRIVLKTSEMKLALFKRYFLGFWCSMLLLYGVFLARHASGTPDLSPSELANHLTAWEVFTTAPFPFLTYSLNNISLWFVFLCFTVLYLPANDKTSKRRASLLVGFSALALVALVALFPLIVYANAQDITNAGLLGVFTRFDAVSGILNAVVLAMLIARLDSKFIGLPSGLILVLYCYSAVQPLFAVFEWPDTVFREIQTLVLVSVFLLKVYFFLIVMYAMQTGRMLNYLFCFPFMARRVDGIFENQFVIREEQESEHAFKFSVLKNHKALYSTDWLCHTREHCDERVRQLRELARDASSYRSREQDGTHWVELVSQHGVLCHSASLRSRVEAKELITESVDMIPYCKFERS